MSKIMGYYALISSPTKVRLWDGFSWQGEVFEDAEIDVAGFVDNLEDPLKQKVDDVASGFRTEKYCSDCSESVALDTQECPACGGFNFSLEMPEFETLKHEAPLELQNIRGELLDTEGFSRFTANARLSNDDNTYLGATMSLAITGYYALISSPLKVRYWNGQGWVGEILENPKIEIVGFVYSLEIVPIKVVVDDDEEPVEQVKYCSACNAPAVISQKGCVTCGSPSFSLTPRPQVQPGLGQQQIASASNFYVPQPSFVQPLNPAPVQNRFCSECGTPIQVVGQAFCVACGSRI